MNQKKKEKNKKNYIIQVLCVFFSLILWVFVMYDENPIDKKLITAVPVKLKDLNKITKLNLIPSLDQNITCDVEVIGKRGIISSLYRSNIDLYLQIDNPVVGENTGNVVVNDDGLAVDIIVNPDKVKINLENIVSKSMPVNVQADGKLTENLLIKKIDISPREVYIKGAESQVEKVNKAVAFIKLNDVKESFSKWADIKFLDKEGIEVQQITATDSSSIINVQIENRKTVPIKYNFSEENYTLSPDYTPSSDTVEIKGDSSIINKIEKIDTEVIDVESLKNRTILKSKLVIPQGIEASINEIEIENTKVENSFKEVEFTKDDINIIGTEDSNLNEELNKNIVLPQQIKVRTEYLENLENEKYAKKENYLLELDYNKYDKEKNIIPLEVKTNLEVVNIIVEPDNVKVQEIKDNTNNENEIDVEKEEKN